MKQRPLAIGVLALTAALGLRGAAQAAEPPAPAPAPAPASGEKAGTGAAPDSFARAVLPFLTKHCYTCHGNGKRKADLALDEYRDVHSIEVDRELWENVLEMIRSGEMPPKPRPRPAASETEAALVALDAVLGALDCSGPRNVGRVTLRRLNRAEYNSTIRDLVGIDFKPAADFPNDDVGYGFDNIGDVLSLSPLLLEKYLSAAEAVLDQAIVIADPPKPMENRLSSLRASFTAGAPRRGGGYFLNGQGRVSGESYVDEGDYNIRAEVYGQQLGDEPVRAALVLDRTEVLQEFTVNASNSAAPMTLEAKLRLKAGTRNIGVAFLNPYTAPPKEGEAPKQVEPPPRRFGFTPRPTDPPTNQRVLIVRNIVLDGPYNPPPVVLPETHRRIMDVEHTADLPPREAARAIVTRFATRAFRRPVKPDEVDRLLALYDQADKEGERFENAVRAALEAVLVWPHFLFRVELDPPGSQPGTSYPIGEYELASRLSYFLWSTMPDDELFALAAQGRLRQNLEAQVRRMLADPKSAALVQNFAGQWLTLGKLAYVNPDPKTFPGFDEPLRAAMVRETELFFEAVLREDRSILDLIDADFSFLNERLARHYGIKGVKGDDFRRVPLGSSRGGGGGGILTQASILTLTSNPTRTSPVKRGKWVLEQILGSPPPPPPPDVPELPETKRLTGSLRKVMEQHRANALCASCHNKMDPIGFAFENYDAVGVWRDRDGGFPIDPAGVLPDGQSFQGPAELKHIIKGKKDDFRRCLTEKMLTYALGRGLEYYDRCAVDAILEALDGSGDKLSSLVLAVTQSEPFQMRTATGEKP
jgi:hypothetical protein